MIGFLLYLLVGGIIGMVWLMVCWTAVLILGGVPGGIIGNIVAGVVGAWIGHSLMGSFGPVIADIAIFPAIIGALIFVAILSIILKAIR